jgi:CDP-diacylglycerol--glycerol-3-phosphate 3-phosphatidyltransferase
MISRKFKVKGDFFFTPLVFIFSKLGLTPNMTSVFGCAVGIVAGVAYGYGEIFWGGILVLSHGILDSVDGAMARRLKMESTFGGFFDSCIDRYSDMAIAIGLIYYFVGVGNRTNVMLGFAFLVGTVMISYTRAKAECILEKCSVGLMEKADRVILLGILSLFHGMFDALSWALWILAILTNVTAIHRIYYSYCQIKKLKL